MQQVRTLLASWEQQVAKLRLEYEQLLFFSIPKLLRLYGLIMSQDDHSDAVSKEVGFLFKNKPEVQYCLKKAVKVRIYMYIHIYMYMYVHSFVFNSMYMYLHMIPKRF